MNSHRILSRLQFQASMLLATGFLLLSFGFSSGLSASVPLDDDPKEKNYQEKLQKPFVKAIPWENSLEEAKKKAAEKNLPIIAYFTRSYAP